MSVYQTVRNAIEALLPDGWEFTGYEPADADLPDVTGLTLKLRTVSRLGVAPIGAYQTEWILTVTSGETSRETADPKLADDLVDFLLTLDETPNLSWLSWTSATKVIGDDYVRLAYDITLTTTTQKEA